MSPKLFALVLIPALLITAQDVENEYGDAERENLKISKQVILEKINEEKRFLIDSFEHVRAMTQSFVEQMKESVQVSLLKELNQLLYKTMEVAEDTLIDAEEAGVLANDCVSKREEAARALQEDGIERMRLCVEDEAEDGFRLREGVRKAVDDVAPQLLRVQRAIFDCIEESEKAEPSKDETERIKTCLMSEEVTLATREKDVADKELEKQLRRARDKRDRGNRCLADVMDALRAEFAQEQSRVRGCVPPPAKQEL